MESLYTKYRPQTFADVVGQTHVVTTLEHAVIEGRTSHAYLFCGPRGTGKTTMARLLAKALMCEQGEGHLPDGTCDQCRMIAAGEHPDVYELDAASRTGVDNVRDEIISRVSFAPVQAPYKMYIIDEVHMLTTAAFNALLKTLEEPPAHVVFVLCTTDPQKIPETILSRVQRFDFHAIGNADIQARLAYICEREGFGYDPEALELVVRHARGGMRDAISELEQLSVSGGGTISVDVARDVLGEVSASTLERISLAMANRDVPVLFAQVESLVEVGRDLLQFTRALAARLRDVYVVAAIGASSGIVAASDDELPAISREAKAFGSVDRVARALALLSDASTEMRVAPNQRLVLEVALTKIARPQSELTLESLADRVASLEKQVVALSVMETRRASEAPKAVGERASTKRERSAASSQQPAEAREGVAASDGRPAASSEAKRHAEQAGRPADTGAVRQADQSGGASAGSGQAYTQSTGGMPGAASAAYDKPSQTAPFEEASASREYAASQSSAPARRASQGAASGAGQTQGNAPATDSGQPGSPAGQASQQRVAAASGQTYAGSNSAALRGVPQQVSNEGSGAPVGAGAGQPSQQGADMQRGAQPHSAQQRTASAGQPVSAPQASQAPATQHEPAAQGSAITDKGELQRRWKQVVDTLLASHPQHGSLLMNSSIVADDGAQLTVSFPKGSMFACRMLDRPDVRANVDPVIAQVFGPRKARFAEGATAPTSQAPAATSRATASASSGTAPQSAAPASGFGAGSAAQAPAATSRAAASASSGTAPQSAAPASGFGAGSAPQAPATQHTAGSELPQHGMQAQPSSQVQQASMAASGAVQPQQAAQTASTNADVAQRESAQTQGAQDQPQYSGAQDQLQHASAQAQFSPSRQQAPSSAFAAAATQPQQAMQANSAGTAGHQQQVAQASDAQAQTQYLAPWEADPSPDSGAQSSSHAAQTAQLGPNAAQTSAAQPSFSATSYASTQPASQSPAALADDMVPYDDFDMSPYEEEFAFGDVPDPVSQVQMNAAPGATVGWQPPSASAFDAAPASRMSTAQRAPAMAPQQPATPNSWAAGNMQAGSNAGADSSKPDATQPQGASAPWTGAATSQTFGASPAEQWGSTPNAASQPGGIADTQAVQAPEAARPSTSDASSSAASAPVQAVGANADNQASATPDTALPRTDVTPGTQADAAPAQQSAASAPAKPKRARRTAPAIPADIIAMMAEIFGEGVTYTSLDPDDQEDEVVEEPSDEDETESEFVDEPVDDADFDEDE